jgi:hypothetical protein
MRASFPIILYLEPSTVRAILDASPQETAKQTGCQRQAQQERQRREEVITNATGARVLNAIVAAVKLNDLSGKGNHPAAN